MMVYLSSWKKDGVNENHRVLEGTHFTQVFFFFFISSTVVLFSFVTKTAISRFLMAQRWVTGTTGP